MKNKVFQQLWPLMIIFIFSALIVSFTELSELDKILDYVFTHTVFVSLFALALTIYVSNYNSISKVKAEIESRKNENNKKLEEMLKKATKRLNKFYKESREDLIYVFFSLILSFIIISCKKIKFSFLELSKSGNLISGKIINLFSLLLLFSTLYAVYDLLKALVLINGREFLN
ncbi:hypothetical protein C8C76_13429 [Halanaerobium saccharolyticum]|jgi:hypothetical protein|uniref:Uncharacterized protein n=1 Tax=Halanaerobium saccharolyticum TaxID=43595 RepID=A0A2T5RGR9_9FIRM|nr:hypothetical protein [Halanaerobium saccharolyticum]PTV94100.1 hypothetical protein C8C76_13429 [Halanaerobium saccharolyticum]